jgi:hypothetical protein
MHAGVHIIETNAAKEHQAKDQGHQSTYKPEHGQNVEDTAPNENLGPAIERRCKVEAEAVCDTT